jgi:hypothetical protein
MPQLVGSSLRESSRRGLKSARLACRLWAKHLAAAVDHVVIWPVMLKAASQQEPAAGYHPQQLLSGIGNGALVELRFSEARLPSAQQLALLCSLLAPTAVCHLSYLWHEVGWLASAPRSAARCAGHPRPGRSPGAPPLDAAQAPPPPAAAPTRRRPAGSTARRRSWHTCCSTS